MGRIRTKFIKNLANKLVERYPDKFDVDFKHNQNVLKEMEILDEKLTRNKLAGYIVRVIRKTAS